MLKDHDPCVVVAAEGLSGCSEKGLWPNDFAFVSLLHVPSGNSPVTAALLMVFYGFKLQEIMYLLLCFAIIEGTI